jgi:predicted  nucleic acid-binding Zn-ribbon protein
VLLHAGTSQTLQEGLDAVRARMDTMASNADMKTLRVAFEKLSSSHQSAQQGIDSAQTQINSILQQITAMDTEASSQCEASAESLARLKAELNSKM